MASKGKYTVEQIVAIIKDYPHLSNVQQATGENSRYNPIVDFEYKGKKAQAVYQEYTGKFYVSFNDRINWQLVDYNTEKAVKELRDNQRNVFTLSPKSFLGLVETEYQIYVLATESIAKRNDKDSETLKRIIALNPTHEEYQGVKWYKVQHGPFFLDFGWHVSNRSITEVKLRFNYNQIGYGESAITEFENAVKRWNAN